MRDHDKGPAGDKRDAPQGPAPPKSKARGAAAPAARPEILGDARLAHEANAEPRADLLRHLQHSHGNAYVQRVVSEMGEPKAPEPKASEPKPAAEPQAHATTAQALDAGAKGEMEAAFGEEFGDVRVHTGRGAGDAAEHLGARAFTRGRDIYFNEGEYNPSTREGKELLAHELAHVVQQRGGAAGAQANAVGAAGDAFETEAHEAAAAVTGGARHQLRGRAGAPAVQREAKQKQSSAPSIKAHPEAITFDKGSGTIDAGGEFTVAYAYTIVGKVQRVPLTLAVPSGVAVSVTPLSGIPAGEYAVQNAEGTAPRAVVISAGNQLPRPPVFQVAFTKGTFTYVVVFQFPTAAPPKSSAQKAAAQKDAPPPPAPEP